MKIFFSFLLTLFSLISMYVTYLFTSSLATGPDTLIALAALGLCFDLLKCSLPSVAIYFVEVRRYASAALCGGVCALLVAFSLYASYSLLDNAVQGKAQTATAYKLTLQQLQAAQLEQENLIKINHLKAAREQVAPRIERLSAELKALSNSGAAGGSAISLIINLIISVLLEISVVACHVAMRARYAKPMVNTANARDIDNVQMQVQRGFLALPPSATNSGPDTTATNSAKLSVAEYAQLIALRGEGDLSYEKLREKYRISPNKIKKIKEVIAQGQQCAPVLSIVQ